MNKGTAIVGFFMCFLAGMLLMWSVDRAKGVSISAETTATGSVDHAGATVPVTAKDPTWGNPAAPVTVVVFSDFQCPFCSRVEPTITQLKTEYKAENLRVVWKNAPLPFHKDARPAAEAAQAVFSLGGSDAFWKFHDLAFQNQQALSEENYQKWAVQAGVDGGKFKQAYSAKTYASKVDEDLALSQKLGANGTPAFRINGVTLVGAQPYPQFKQIVDQQLGEAKKLIAAGTRPADVYVELTKKNAAVSPEQPSQQQQQKPQEPPEDTAVWKVPVNSDDPVRGNKDALVTIVEFSDFQCPFCKRVGVTMKQIMDKYKDDVRIVWKDTPLPFHPRAKPAATLARHVYKAKGNAGFWAVHDDLFESQPKLEDDDLKTIAEKHGGGWSQIQSEITSGKFDDKFNQCAEQASDLNARGTPHFFVNGRRVQGAQPIEKFTAVIDEQLAKAKAIVARGIPRSQVYDEVMKEGKEPPPAEKKEVPPPASDSPTLGSAGAKVVIQEWSDFQCPFCKRVTPTLKQLEQEYGSKIKVVWRHMPLPFHDHAQLAAEAAQEVYAQKGDKAFWEYHDKLFASQEAPGG
ncbi:MAG TPA: thioredoxin domain-containing protein, partial [Polyangiaceae bacterium]